MHFQELYFSAESLAVFENWYKSPAKECVLARSSSLFISNSVLKFGQNIIIPEQFRVRLSWPSSSTMKRLLECRFSQRLASLRARLSLFLSPIIISIGIGNGISMILHKRPRRRKSNSYSDPQSDSNSDSDSEYEPHSDRIALFVLVESIRSMDEISEIAWRAFPPGFLQQPLANSNIVLTRNDDMNYYFVHLL